MNTDSAHAELRRKGYACKCGRFKGIPIACSATIDVDGELHSCGGCIPAEEEPIEVTDDMIEEIRDIGTPPPFYDPRQPPPGSWAETARAMASIFPDSDFDWDAWKDEMKERDYE